MIGLVAAVTGGALLLSVILDHGLRSIAAELKASREPRGAMEALRSLQAFAEAMEQRASKEPSFYEAAGAYGDMAAQIRARLRRIEGAGGEA